jgi:hypothetical protein
MKAWPAKLAASVLAWGLSASPTAARASWLETHVTEDEVHVEVDRTGSAVVEHAITMRIHGGPLRSFDVAGVDPDAVPLADASVISARTEGLLGLPVPLGLSMRPDGALRVNVESPRGISRGLFLFRIRYRTNLLVKDRVERDGAMLRVRWTGPSFPDGIDNVRCTFVFPAAPTEPRPGHADPGTDRASELADEDEEGAFISTVKRYPDRDEVELLRPHVARAEAVTWSVRVDPRALAETGDPRLRPMTPPPPRQLVPPETRVPFVALGSALMLGFSMLVGLKARQTGKATRAAGLSMRPLLPIGTPLRILLSGPLLTLGIFLQLVLDDPLWGTGLVLGAMAVTSYLPPRWRPQPRGPGRWLPLSDTEAFAVRLRPRQAWLDAGTRWGALLLGAGIAACLTAAYFVLPVSSYAAHLILFDSAALVPLFGTGCLRGLPPEPLSGPAPRLFAIARELRKRPALRAVPCGRLPDGSDRFDELRLVVSPRLPHRGLAAIEVGYALVQGAGGFIQIPEVLVRVVDGSPCHEAFVGLLRGHRWVRGRKADERVAVVRPRLPTIRMTTALALRLAEHARDAGDAKSVRPKTPVSRRAA